MRRRNFISGLGGAAALALQSPSSLAQRANIPRVGYLFPFTRAESQDLWQACRQGLRELGHSEGQSIVLEPRWAEGQYDQLPGLLNELLQLKVDVMVVASSPVSRAAKAATSTIPIVFVAVADPVGIGLVSSLSRPGGNMTGLSLLTTDLSGKRLALLMEIVGKLSRVAVLLNPASPSTPIFLAETKAAAGRLGIELPVMEARNPAEIDGAFAAYSGHGADALMIFDDPTLWSHRAKINALAAARRVPTLAGFRDYVDEGGLISYGPDRPDHYRRTATFVDKILKGAKPADLPVEQAVKFQLIINNKTAKALGLSIPTTLLATADEVIE
jgi:putative tryptophan/tyrosine transport system substrate-binding protein